MIYQEELILRGLIKKYGTKSVVQQVAGECIELGMEASAEGNQDLADAYDRSAAKIYTIVK